MANPPFIQPPAYWPNIDGKVPPEVVQVHRLTFNALNDHETAIINLKAQLAAATVTTTTTQAATVVPASSSTTTTGTVLGAVNNQTGTSYVTLLSDSGATVTFRNASAIAVTLNNSVATPFICFIENLGTGTATLTPSAGLVNGVASITLVTGQGCYLTFDGSNWWAVTSLVAPIATISSPGLVQPDGTTITISGNIISAPGGGGGPTITTNSNGTQVDFGGAYIHQFGTAGPSGTGVDRTSFAVTFPVAFAGIPKVVCSVTNDPDGYGTAVFPCYPTGITTTGFTANITAGVTIGGGGPANINNATFIDWMADYV